MSWLDKVTLSDESKDTFAALKNHWRHLFAWGLKTKIPSQHPNWEAWEAFEREWLADRPNVTDLQAQVSGLRAAEIAAQEKGFKPPQDKIAAPDIEDATVLLKGAAIVDQEAKKAEEVAKDVIKNAAKEVGGAASGGLKAVWNELPLWGKGVVVVGGAGLVVSTVSNVADAISPRRRR